MDDECLAEERGVPITGGAEEGRLFSVGGIAESGTAGGPCGIVKCGSGPWRIHRDAGRIGETPDFIDADEDRSTGGQDADKQDQDAGVEPGHRGHPIEFGPCGKHPGTAPLH